MNQLSRWTCYTEMDQEISKELGNIATGFVYLGYLFKQARDTELFREAGYHSLYEYVQDKYSITRTQALRFMQINDTYSINGDSPEIDPKYIGYGSSKLTEMLGIPEEIRSEIPADVTVKELRSVKALVADNETEKNCATVAQTQVNTGDCVDFDPIENIVKSYFETNREEYKKYFEIAQYDQKLVNYLTKDKLFNVLAPSKFKMIRIEKGNLMINEAGLKLLCWTGEKYQVTHEEFRTMFLQVFTGGLADSYHEVYGKPLDDPKPVEPVKEARETKSHVELTEIEEEITETEEKVTKIEEIITEEPKKQPEEIRKEKTEEEIIEPENKPEEPFQVNTPAAGHVNQSIEVIKEEDTTVEDKEELPEQTIYSFLLTSSIEEQAEYFKNVFDCPPNIKECLDIEMGESCVTCWKEWLNQKKED